MLYYNEIIDILKNNQKPTTIKYLARKLNVPRKVINASFRYLKNIENNRNIIVYLRSSHSVKKRPIYSYKEIILKEYINEKNDDLDSDEELNNININDKNGNLDSDEELNNINIDD